jgi:serine/threonine protein kinase/tetratricopeptide (TPR) repeat protein
MSVSSNLKERLVQAEMIFQDLLEAPTEERLTILADRSAGDPELRALVERLLEHDEKGMGTFLTPPTRAVNTRPVPPETPSYVGPYRIVEGLAAGGMGTVYRAQQTKPIKREVALKVIRAGLGSQEIVARFEAERQALALMDHPNIARVLNAGETEQAQPYFVMELIQGIPITEYCDQHRLGLPERLELFRMVCEAVQHAHQKAVIHRDLKPSNVLVAEVNGKPVPKVIDFGVAKAVGRRLTERTMHTLPGMVIGTPEYMSPEHADPESVDLDTRADVYSLGVILYELLVGARPFEGGGALSLMRRIREEEPKRPSTRMEVSDESSVERARARGTEAGALRRLLRRDLDWIVMKALEKDRGHRYASPAELAAEVQRHLRDESVEARPPTVAYRTKKFVRRHRLGVTAAGIVVVSLVGAVVGATTALVRARRAEAQARAEQERAQKASDFLASTLQGITPTEMAFDLAARLRTGGREPAAGESSGPGTSAPDPMFKGFNLIDEMRSLVDEHVLDRAVKRIETELAGEPALAADLYFAIGPAYEAIDSILVCMRRAVELDERARGPDDPKTLVAKWGLGVYCVQAENYAEGQEILREVLESFRRIHGQDAPMTIRAIMYLGQSYQRRSQAWVSLNDPERRPPRTPWLREAVPLLREALERSRRVLGDDARVTLNAAVYLALALGEDGSYVEAEEMLRETIARCTRVLGENDAWTLNARMALVAVVYYSGRVEEAIAMGQELRENMCRALGEDSGLTITMGMKLGVLQLEEGRIEEAEPLLRDAARKLRSIAGGTSQFTLECEQALARLERLKQESPQAKEP